jgi:hypothetical protein
VTRAVAIPAPAALVAAVAAIDDGARRGAPLPAMRELATGAARLWVEAVLDGFVLALAREIRGGPSGGRTVALARGVADRVIDHGARRADANAMAAVVAFFAARVVARAPAPVIAFPVDGALDAALAPALGASPTADAVAAALHALLDSALDHLLDQPIALLGLGAVARAAVAVGRAGLASRAHRGIDRAIADLDAIGRMAGFLARSIVAGDGVGAVGDATVAQRGG